MERSYLLGNDGIRDLMMKIVYTDNSGNTCIVNPAAQENVAKVLPDVANMSTMEYVEFIKNKDVPADATNISIVPADSIPVDRTFRNALKHDLTHDKQKCVDITNARLRAERAPLLAELDVQVLRAQETGAETALFIAEKQRLRDITKLANPSMTLEELKALKA